jgi:uncharacterized protein (TIGR03435 family)
MIETEASPSWKGNDGGMNKQLCAALSAPALVVALSVYHLKALAAASPVFEVASLRPYPSPRGTLVRPWLPTFQCPPGFSCGILGNRFREQGVTLAELIVDAYKVKRFQIAGLPAWGDSGDVYDLDAKVAGENPPTADQVRLMLQAFLADRFQLRIHHESRMLPVYSLVVAKQGVKLIPNKAPCLGVPGVGDGNAPGTPRKRDDSPLPWSFYVEQLSVYAHQPVIDETGLDGGGYCTRDGVDPLKAVLFETRTGASVFTAAEEKWGMKLESKKAPVDVVVVDKVEKPSEN